MSYDCTKCPGYCCSYPIIAIEKRDVQRLAKHFGISFTKARKRFTFSDKEDKYIMRRKADEHFGRICQFFDSENRRCGVYQARPSTCRAYPGGNHCGYYAFLKFERDWQDDKDSIALTDNH